MSDTFDRLQAILVKDYKASPGVVSSDTPLDALGIDSLGTVELLWSIEEAFRIKLPPDPVLLPTVGDVVRYIDELIASQAAGGSGDPGRLARQVAP